MKTVFVTGMIMFLTHIATPPPQNHKKRAKFSYFQAIFVAYNP